MSSTASKKPAKKRATLTSKKPKLGIGRSASASAKAAQALFKELGFSPGDSRREAVKAELYVAILQLVREQEWSPKQVGELIGKPHSRVSELLNGKLGLVTVDTLIGYLVLSRRGVGVSAPAIDGRWPHRSSVVYPDKLPLRGTSIDHRSPPQRRQLPCGTTLEKLGADVTIKVTRRAG